LGKGGGGRIKSYEAFMFGKKWSKFTKAAEGHEERRNR